MGLGMMKIGVTAAVALLVIGMVFSMAPAIGGTIEDATPTLSVSSSWNATHNTDLTEGGDFFATYGNFVGIVVIGLLGGAVIMMWIRF